LFYDKAKRLTLAIIETEDDPQKFFPESAQGLLTAAIMWEVMQAKIEARPPSLPTARQFVCERDEWEEAPPVMHGKHRRRIVSPASRNEPLTKRPPLSKLPSRGCVPLQLAAKLEARGSISKATPTGVRRKPASAIGSFLQRAPPSTGARLSRADGRLARGPSAQGAWADQKQADRTLGGLIKDNQQTHFLHSRRQNGPAARATSDGCGVVGTSD
jgi:hypothetical protein